MGRDQIIEDDIEETLSLIDLPITPSKPISDQDKKSTIMVRQDSIVKNRTVSEEDEEEQGINEFDFGSTRFEMSSADELFLHGQILPLRLSVDSKIYRGVDPGQPESLSGSSVCRSSSVEFTSSRSSYSSSTSSVNAVNNKVAKTAPCYQPRIRNNFHAHPSPTPRLRGSIKSNVGPTNLNRLRKSSVWDVFRLGPVQPTVIELKDLKTRIPTNPSQTLQTQKLKMKHDKKSNKSLKVKQRMGCRCTADTVENVQRRIVGMKCGDGERRSDFEGEIEEVRRRMKEKGMVVEEGMPRRRTFEWLEQLSVEEDLKVKY